MGIHIPYGSGSLELDDAGLDVETLTSRIDSLRSGLSGAELVRRALASRAASARP